VLRSNYLAVGGAMQHINALGNRGIRKRPCAEVRFLDRFFKVSGRSATESLACTRCTSWSARRMENLERERKSSVLRNRAPPRCCLPAIGCQTSDRLGSAQPLGFIFDACFCSDREPHAGKTVAGLGHPDNRAVGSNLISLCAGASRAQHYFVSKRCLESTIY